MAAPPMFSVLIGTLGGEGVHGGPGDGELHRHVAAVALGGGGAREAVWAGVALGGGVAPGVGFSSPLPQAARRAPWPR